MRRFMGERIFTAKARRPPRDAEGMMDKLSKMTRMERDE
jgi:hypothetical protein